MRTLVYKRTHTGDPDASGCFGIECCMGRDRAWDFDAVIGVGGIGREAVREGIDRKITWVGIGPKPVGVACDEHPILAFEKFYLKDERGLLLKAKAPKLAKRMFKPYALRAMMDDLDADELKEIEVVLKLAKNSSPSPALLGMDAKPKMPKCKPRRNNGC
jgi:hypothetical protein